MIQASGLLSSALVFNVCLFFMITVMYLNDKRPSSGVQFFMVIAYIAQLAGMVLSGCAFAYFWNLSKWL